MQLRWVWLCTNISLLIRNAIKVGVALHKYLSSLGMQLRWVWLCTNTLLIRTAIKVGVALHKYLSLGLQLRWVWLLHKHSFHFGMQLKDPVYTGCVHLCRFIVPSAVVVLAVSLFHTGVNRAQPATTN